jgi:transposase-like protein
MTETKRRIRREYTDEQKEQALARLAVQPNCAAVGRELGIPKATLLLWKKTYATRYEEIRSEILPRIQAKMAVDAEDAALRQAELEAILEEQLLRGVADLSPKDAAGALRNVSTAKAINVDKSQLLRGNPTAIVETRDASDIARSIRDRFPHLVIDSTCEELPPAGELEAG